MAGGGVPGGRSEGEQLELVRSLRKEWGEHKRSLADMLTLVDVASPRRAVEYERVRYHEIHVSDGGEDDLFHWNPAVKSSNTPPPPLPPPPPPPPASVPQHYFSNGSTPLRNVSPERQRSAERMASSGYWLESRRSLTPRLRSPWLRSSRPASPIGGTPPLQPAAVFERRAPPPPRPTSEPQGDLFTPHQHSPRPSPGPTPPLSPFPRDIATPDPGYAYTPSLRSAHGGRGQNVADPQPGGGADEDDDIFFDDQTFDPFQEDAPPASGVETPPMDALSFPSGTRRPSYQENGFDDERKAADLICSLSALELALDHAPIALQRRKQAGGGPNGATRHGTNPDLPQAKRPPFPLGAASDVSTAFDVPTATRSHRERGGSSTRKPMISPLPPQSVPAKDAPHTRASFAGAPQGPGKPRPVQRAAQPSQPPYVAAFDRTVPQPGGAGGRQGAPDAAAQQNAEFAGGAAATRQGAGASWTAANARKLPSQQQQQQLQQQQVQQQPPAAGFRVRSPPADASEPSGTAANARKLPSQQQQLQQQQLQQQQQQQQPPAAGFRVRSPLAEASEPGGNWAPSAVQCVPRAPPSARARDGQPAASNGNSTGPQQAPPQHLRTPLAQQQAAGEAADDSVSADPRHPLRTPPQRQERRGSHPEASFAEEPTANGAASAAAVPSTKTAAEPPPAKGAKRGPADEAPSESGTSEPQTARQTAAPGFKPAAWRTDTATETGSPVTTVRAGSGSPVSPGSGSPVKQPGQAPSRAQLFWKRYGKKVTDGRTKCGVDAKNIDDNGTGVIYALLNEGGTVLYVGQTSKTAEMRNTKHWENRNSKSNRVSQQLRKRGRKLYACPVQNVPERLYTQPADFPRVALPIEDFWIKWLNPPLNMTNRRQGEKVGRRPQKKKKRQRPPQRLRKRRNDGNVWHRMQDGELRIDTSPGFCSGLRKQLDHLIQLPLDQLGAYDMSTWHPNRALRLRTWMRTFVQGESVTEKVRTLERLLGQRIRNRTDKKAAPPRRYFKLTHQHPAQDRTAIAGVLSRTRVRDACPNPAVLDNLMVSNRLKPPLATLVCNVTEVSYETSQPVRTESVCPCQQHNVSSNYDGHALGLATDLKTDEALLSLFRKGRKYRVASSPMSLYDSMRHDVEEFVDLNFGKCSENEKSHFAATLTQEFDAVLGTLNAHTDEPHLRDALRALKKLQEHLVILPVDKTSHDFGFICKEKYKELVRNELQQSSTYQQLDSSVESILQQHQAFNKSHNFPHSNILPYLYGIPKLHKPQPRMRYIAGVSEKGNAEKKDEQKVQDERRAHKKQPKTRASTTPAHQEASGILKLVLATLQGKDEVSRAKTGIRRFFVVESIDGVAVHIKTNYARLRKKTPRTFDFKEMYTKIPQQRIVDYVMLAVLEAFEYAKSEKGFDLKAQRSKHRFEFSNAEAADMTAYSVEEIRELVEFIVGNTFVTNGGRCYQQVTGIPMGGNASPDLANLYCYWCEKLYIDSLIAEGRHEEARAHADSVRFIDDFLTWGVRPPPEAIYGMEYSETSKGVDDVVFLGMRIRAERDIKTDYIRLSVLDKGEEFPWYPIKYTHAESTVPRNTGTSIFKGALIRAARICNNMPDLKVEIMKVYYRLRNRGFSGRELRHVFDTFVTQTYGKYELDARVLSRFYYYVGKAYDEGRPTNVEKRFIGIRAPQQPAAPPESPSPPKRKVQAGHYYTVLRENDVWVRGFEALQRRAFHVVASTFYFAAACITLAAALCLLRREGAGLELACSSAVRACATLGIAGCVYFPWLYEAEADGSGGDGGCDSRDHSDHPAKLGRDDRRAAGAVAGRLRRLQRQATAAVSAVAALVSVLTVCLPFDAGEAGGRAPPVEAVYPHSPGGALAFHFSFLYALHALVGAHHFRRISLAFVLSGSPFICALIATVIGKEPGDTLPVVVLASLFVGIATSWVLLLRIWALCEKHPELFPSGNVGWQ
ncbi:hypothetical protein DIPPA_04207 [Diplonema papillatum]|nr:hypothetical protein DIPPA_04207 [Diplonema papillatum]